jgi:hypothetical protein
MQGVDCGSAVRYLVGGSDAPPLDVQGERDLGAIVDACLGDLDTEARLRFGVALLMAYVQHEVVGPPIPADLLAVHPEATKEICEQMGLAASAACHLLWMAHRVLAAPSLASQDAAVWRARLFGRLREASAENRRDWWEEEERAWDKVPAQLHLQERALMLGGQDRWADALRLVAAAKESVGLKATLSGRMGRRTKYQTFDCAQLVLVVEVDDREAEEEDGTKEEAVAEVGLGEESILLERGRGQDDAALSGEQQSLLVLEGLCIARRHARDELTLGLALPYVAQVLYRVVLFLKSLCLFVCFCLQVLAQGRSPFAVRSAALFVRSLLEAHMSRTRDRAALQLEALYEGWHSEADSSSSEQQHDGAKTRLATVWGCPVPLRQHLLLESAKA